MLEEKTEGEAAPPPRMNTSTDVSATRLYLGNLPRDVTKEEIMEYFKTHGTGNITEVKLMSGFGFLEYEDPMDARDVVPAFRDGTEFKGQRLTVQFARGTRPRQDYHNNEHRPGPRPRRTAFRMSLTNLPDGTSWQDLKDFARRPGLDVVYSEVSRGDGRGFVEYESSNDLRTAVEKLNDAEFKGVTVHCVVDEQAEAPSYGGGHRNRSRSPRWGNHPYDDYYRRGPPRGYSPRRDDYRRRTPPPRDEYYARDRYRSPPRMRPPPDEPYPPRSYRDDLYGRPPPRGYRDDLYANGYERPPPRRTPPPHSGGYGYDDRRGYW